MDLQVDAQIQGLSHKANGILVFLRSNCSTNGTCFSFSGERIRCFDEKGPSSVGHRFDLEWRPRTDVQTHPWVFGQQPRENPQHRHLPGFISSTLPYKGQLGASSSALVWPCFQTIPVAYPRVAKKYLLHNSLPKQTLPGAQVWSLTQFQSVSFL